VAVCDDLDALSSGHQRWRGNTGGPWLLIDADPDRVQQVPAEFFLRELLAVDAADVDAVAAWVGEWGVLAPPPMLRGRMDELRLISTATTTEAARVVAKSEGRSPAKERSDFKRTLRRDLDGAASAAGVFELGYYEDDFYEWEGVTVSPAPFPAISFCIRVHQLLVHCWAAMPPDVSADWLANNSVAALWPWLAVSDAFSPSFASPRTVTPCCPAARA